ncbi:hypothetical protein PR048_029814 [Dryococelus australis]|uniref:Uncharacterized protein n=1 Tax=Dryococelus australis TaxID=614101 RepID=A0ABQ9G767_9NEOP|nr:hypothetical protein PR048_029814 [Dryococelus australis]
MMLQTTIIILDADSLDFDPMAMNDLKNKNSRKNQYEDIEASRDDPTSTGDALKDTLIQDGGRVMSHDGGRMTPAPTPDAVPLSPRYPLPNAFVFLPLGPRTNTGVRHSCEYHRREELKARIRAAFETIKNTTAIFNDVLCNMLQRCRACVECGVDSSKHLLCSLCNKLVYNTDSHAYFLIHDATLARYNRRFGYKEEFSDMDLNCTVQRYDGNTARLARRSDEALEVRVTVARIAPSLLDLGRSAT